MNWDDYGAVLFDLDGVLTPTAEVHMRAWRELFVDFLTRRGVVDQPYTERDYFDHIDGKPRYDGVRSLLASRGLHLAGWVGNVVDPQMAGLDDNVATLRRWIKAPHLGTIPRLPRADAHAAASHLDIAPLLAQ